MRPLAALALLGLTFFTAGAAQQKHEEEKKVPEFRAAQANATAEPQYPNNSVAQGTVTLELTIDPEGDLEKVAVLRPLASLTEEAERAVRKWTFRAATLDGRPVRSTMIVSFTFRTIIPPSK